MTEEKIIEGNKLIAESTGWRFDKPNENTVYAYYNGQKRWIDNDRFLREILVSENGFAYHKDWNKLIPIVKTIHDICYKHQYKLSNESWNQRDIKDELENPLHWKSWSYHNVSLSTDINIVWNAVVLFFNWYNLHNPSTPTNDTENSNATND